MISLKLYEEMAVDDERRFYPNSAPVIPLEPLKTNFQILESPEDIKKGVISLVTFNPEDIIAVLTGYILNFQNLHTLQKAPGEFISDTFFSGYLLHSCEPNCQLSFEPYSLMAVKKIKPFDLLTIDYEKTEDKLHQTFDCKCGSPNCRGWIAGKKVEK